MATRFSIVTCSYQQGRFLDATMRSVLDQAYPHLEYTVIDGGSTDTSVSVIERHAKSLAHWVSEKDAGQTSALIKGFAATRGELMGWLCSDDLLLPGSLAYVADYFERHPEVQAVYGDALWIDERGDFLRAKKEGPFNRHAFLFDHNYLPQPSTFWRRSLYDKVGGLDAGFNLAMDSDLWERFSRQTQWVHLPRYLSCMRYYPEQKTRALRPKGALEDARIRSRSALAAWPLAAPVLKLSGRATRLATKALAGGYFPSVPNELKASLATYRIAA